jgi:anti-anti-sigma factor
LGDSNREALPRPTRLGPFIIDLSGVTSADASGLGLMAEVMRHAWRSEVGACFLTAPPSLRDRLRAAKLDRLFPLETTMEDALDRVRREAAAVRMVPPATEDGRLLLFQMPPRLTAENAADCLMAIEGKWEARPGMRVLVLDFEDTTFMDSSGLGALLKLRRSVAGRSGTSMRLTHLHDNVLNVIRLAKVEAVLLQP